MTDAVDSAKILAPTTAPALRLLGAAGAVCVDGICTVEPTVAADPQ